MQSTVPPAMPHADKCLLGWILIGLLLACPTLHAAGGSSASDDAWYTEPQVYSFRPRLDQPREFGPIGVTGIGAHIGKGVVVTVESVEDGSPATGLFAPGDVILGVNGEALKGKNPYVALGNALTKAEATDGKLLFEVKDRAGTQRVAEVSIPVLGGYSPTFPHACPKSDRIVKEAAAYYAAQLTGKAEHPVKIGELEQSLVGLFLLATGDDRYLPVVKQLFAEEIEANQPVGDGASTWFIGYRGVLCGEYYLRTGDKSVLPLMQNYCDAAKLGQRYNCSWAHKIFDTPTVYWLMNAAGTQMLTTMLLGKECGVDVDETTLRNALRFWYRFAGHGSVPYGDHRPGGGLGSDGKDGMSAAAMLIASHAQGDVARFEKAHKWCINAMANQYPAMIMGHGDNGRGDAIWRGISLARLQDINPERYRTEMDRHKWWLDLSRLPGGGFRVATLQKFGDVGSGVTIPLFYAAQRKALQITGAPRSPHAKAFTLPAFDWGTEADLAFLSTEPCEGYESYGPDEEIHISVNRLIRASKTNRRSPVAFPEKLPLAYLLKNVRHQEIEVRIAAAKALRHFGYLDELEKLLSDPDPRLRRAALDGLLDWRGFFHMGKQRITTEQYTPGMLDALSKILKNPDEAWWVTDGALFAMNGAPASAVEQNLAAMLPWTRSDEGYLRMASFLGLLGASKDPHVLAKVLPTLADMLSDPRLSNRGWMNPLLAGVLKEHQGNAEVAKIIRGGFIRAIQDTSVLPNEGLYRRQAEGLAMIKGSASALMKQSPAASLAMAETIAARLPEMIPGELIGLVSPPSINIGPKHRLGLYTMVARQQDAGDRDKLIRILDEKYRPRLIEMLNDGVREDLRSNLILSIADIAKLADSSKGWQALGTPTPENLKWRYYTFNTPSEKTISWSHVMTRNDFTNAKVPPGMDAWQQPDFDDSEWAVGAGPFGKGHYEGAMKAGGRYYPIGVYFENRTTWPAEHEFLMMRTTLDLDPDALDYGLYRLSVLSAGCYKVFVNGKQVELRAREEGFPRYVGTRAKSLQALNLKKGRNTIAVISNHMLKKGPKPWAQIDLRLEGLRASDLTLKATGANP